MLYRPAIASKAVKALKNQRVVGLSTSMAARPKIIAFDLDGTLWWPELYMMNGPPFKYDARRGCVLDRRNEEMHLMHASHRVLSELVTDSWLSDSSVAYVSRTEYPQWGHACLKLFQLEGGKTMDDLGKYYEIYPGTKTRHFRQIQKSSGVAFEDMIFFDNERRNIIDCSKLGITCIYTPDGLTEEAWRSGLAQFAAAAAQRS